MRNMKNVRSATGYRQQLPPRLQPDLKNNVLIYGEPLSNLVFNEAEFVGSDGKTVTGILAWKEAAATPDAGTAGAVWIFTPADEKYAALEGTAAITVNKAQNAPNMPGSAMDVPNSLKKAGDVSLPEGWEWQAADREKALAVEVPVEAVAVYAGADKGNYEKETVTVAITRSACDHDWHITNEEAATTASEGKRVYTCSKCSQTREESIPKLPPDQTPGQTEKPDSTETPAELEPQETVTPKEIRENSEKLDSGISIKWKGKALALKWKRTAGYDIFANQSGKKLDNKSLVQTVKNGKTSISITKIAGKKISGKKVFSVKVKAWKYVDGKKTYTGESRTYHIAGKENKKYTNVKKLKPKKTKYTLKKGRNARIQVTVVKESKKKKLLPKSYGPALQYRSGNQEIAAVTQKGGVKAKKKGTCYIYVTALNGVRTKIKITVK